MGSSQAEKKVFISYVREDSVHADRLRRYLQNAQIPSFLDRDSINPGANWRQALRTAIERESLVFLACFSSVQRDESTQNEEIRIAIEAFKRLPPGRTWIIPVRFEDVELPDWRLDADTPLSAINWVNLFGVDETSEALRLMTTINRMMGKSAPDDAAIAATLAAADDATRADALDREIRLDLLDPSKKIHVSELVSDEAQRIIDALSDRGRFSSSFTPGASPAAVQAAQRALDYASRTLPLAATIATATEFGNDLDQVRPWITSLGNITEAAYELPHGVAFTEMLENLRRLPPLILLTTAATVAIWTRKWWLLKALAVDTTVTQMVGYSRNVPLAAALEPWSVFRDREIPHYLRIALARKSTADDAYANRGGFSELLCPIDQWLAPALRPAIDPRGRMSDARYDAAFDDAITWLGILSVDASRALGGYGVPWLGRATITRYRDQESLPQVCLEELAQQGARWEPLRAGLFGGDPARALASLNAYKEAFDEARARRHW